MSQFMADAANPARNAPVFRRSTAQALQVGIAHDAHPLQARSPAGRTIDVEDPGIPGVIATRPQCLPNFTSEILEDVEAMLGVRRGFGDMVGVPLRAVRRVIDLYDRRIEQKRLAVQVAIIK